MYTLQISYHATTQTSTFQTHLIRVRKLFHWLEIRVEESTAACHLWKEASTDCLSKFLIRAHYNFT